MNVFKQTSGSTNSESAKNDNGVHKSSIQKIFDEKSIGLGQVKPIFTIQQTSRDHINENKPQEQELQHI